MKVAFICDDLIQDGGAEKVFEYALSLFPDAPVYTSVATPQWKARIKEQGHELYTSFLQDFPFAVKLNRYYSALLFHVLAFESFNLREYDLVLSFSSRYAHFVVTTPETKHICFMHTPGRMFWEPTSYFSNENYGYLSPFKKLSKPFLSPFLSKLRMLDYAAAHRVDHIISNSVVTQKRVKKYYGLESKIINPFIDDLERFITPDIEQGSYFITLTRLAAWKRLDIAIEACNELGINLKVIGEGPDRERLEEISGETIEFMGRVSDVQKALLIQGCKGMIQTQKEDFGISSVECQYFGKPVIAYGIGGALETIKNGKTGLFYKEQTKESVSEALTEFNEFTNDTDLCKQTAAKYSKERFKERLLEFINSVYL